MESGCTRKALGCASAGPNVRLDHTLPVTGNQDSILIAVIVISRYARDVEAEAASAVELAAVESIPVTVAALRSAAWCRRSRRGLRQRRSRARVRHWQGRDKTLPKATCRWTISTGVQTVSLMSRLLLLSRRKGRSSEERVAVPRTVRPDKAIVRRCRCVSKA